MSKSQTALFDYNCRSNHYNAAISGFNDVTAVLTEGKVESAYCPDLQTNATEQSNQLQGRLQLANWR